MKIIIPGKPIAKMRARYSKRGKHVITYDPQDLDKKVVKQIMTAQLVERINITDRIVNQEIYEICNSKVFSVQFLFFLPVNQSDSVSARNRKCWNITRAATKPDYDNLEKFYLDCANGILWDDDAMIIKASAQKLYSEYPRVEIEVNAVKEVFISDKIDKVITSFSPSEFRELQQDAKQIYELNDIDASKCDDDFIQQWITNTATVLSEFSLKHAHKLTKIAKIGELKSGYTTQKEFDKIFET